MTNLQLANLIVTRHPTNKHLIKVRRTKNFPCQNCIIRLGNGEGTIFPQVTNTGCDTCFEEYTNPAHLEHYLRVLHENGAQWVVDTIGQLWRIDGYEHTVKPEKMRFNLTTGKPTTEKDAEAFVKLIKG